MRLMYDSTNGHDIPPHAEMVAGYVDGNYVWSDDEWNRFPSAVKVRIAVFPSTNDGHVLDVEPGNAGPTDRAVGTWIQRRRDAGVEPSIYLPASWWDAMRRSLDSWGIAHPHWWIAQWDNRATLLNGSVAKQYINPPVSGGHYDLSVVADYWPGVDSPNNGGGGGSTPTIPAWPLPAGHYFGPIWGPNESHGGWYASEQAHIRSIQLKLCEKGFARRNNGDVVTDANGWSDGIYGQATVNAMINAQTAWGYHRTGNVWPDDWNQLFS